MCWSTGRRRRARTAIGGTAVFGEKFKKPIHRREIGGVENKSAVLPRGNQMRMRQFLEMKTQGRRRQIQLRRNFAGCQPGGPLLHQQAINSEASFLRQCGERFDGGRRFHISNTMVISTALSSADIP